MTEKKTKKVLYEVQCAFSDQHIFEKIFEVEEGTENVDTNADAFCPFCGKMVSITVKGRMKIDTSIFRSIEED